MRFQRSDIVNDTTPLNAEDHQSQAFRTASIMRSVAALS